MNISSKFSYIFAGLALFAMFFGAGNIVFSLTIGVYSLDLVPYAVTAFLLTAVVVPFCGLFTVFLYRGSVDLFFCSLGRIPGRLLACLIIALLGPFGSAPRCLTLAYSTLSLSFPNLSATLFHITACALIFLLVLSKTRFLMLLGYVLAPIKIMLLMAIIGIGLFFAQPSIETSPDQLPWNHFLYGLQEGYSTMDLLAAFFFAPIVLASLMQRASTSQSDLRRFLIKALCVGAVLLAIVYIGFSYTSYLHAQELVNVPNERLLAALITKLLGPWAGVFVGVVIAVSCLTTAIALIAAFTHFIGNVIFSRRISHVYILICTLALTFAISTLEFQGIVKMLRPVLNICYPLLIAVTLYNFIKVQRSPKTGRLA